MKTLLKKTLKPALTALNLTGLVFLIACSPQEFKTQINPSYENNNSDFSGIPEILSSSEIIGGTQVKNTESLISSIVGIYDLSVGSICTGSIIDENIVLTAAHCINSDPSQMVILFGSNIAASKVYRQVDFAGAHKKYQPQDQEESEWNDIGLIHFVGTLPRGFKPAQFLPESYKFQAGEKTLLAGYGLSDGVNKKGSAVLRKVSVSIANPNFLKTQIVLDQRFGKGACHGDSGGPAYIQTKNGLLLWGVTSRGYHDQNDHCNQYAVYTNSLQYMSWIKDAKVYFDYQFKGQGDFAEPTHNSTALASLTQAQLDEMRSKLFMQ